MSRHAFNRHSKHFCLSLDLTFRYIDPKEDDVDAPSKSQNNRPIIYGPISATTNLGSGSPTPMQWLSKKRVKNPTCKCKAPDTSVHRSTKAKLVK
ncbi:hypothetical protein GUJ93_ZPchr0005g15138 [Zizania palustris]|uniref:Uncharacterized protein n=1 Tax=Zizania palustris TaxID=103762 RepID=A0A8J5VI58_ZIZPA|nr:hypothetical protein GUJ93_ZPchr0005g15138 [Zizania palustris]